MLTTDRPIHTLTARDLMTTEVEVIPQEMSLQAAGRLLSQARISGAPVVDETGRCVGVLSASDFIYLAGKSRQAAPASACSCVCSDWQVADVESLPRDEVRQHMTADPVVATPATRIVDLAQMMLDAHIHRIIVVDRMRRPIGIVSTTDIVAAVAAMKRGLLHDEASVRDGTYQSADTRHGG
jgi:CBS domain-containing protein